MATRKNKLVFTPETQRLPTRKRPTVDPAVAGDHRAALARILELEEGLRYILGRLRWGGDILAIRKGQSLLAFSKEQGGKAERSKYKN